MQRLFIAFAVVVLGCFVIPANPRSQDTAEYLKNAKAWSEKREYDKAIAECDNALAISPKCAEAFITRGTILRTGRYEKAIAD